MLALSVALMAEAKPLIQHFRLKKSSSTPYHMWENEELVLIVTGTGKLFTAAACSFLLGQRNNIALFVNIGIAGHASLEIGTSIVANKIIDAQENKSFYPTILCDLPCPSLAVTTLLKPSKEYREECCFDMEASGFCMAVSKFLPFEMIHVLKVISDNSSSPSILLNEKKISHLLFSQCSLMENFLCLLKKNSLSSIKKEESFSLPPPFDVWHFTHAQKEKLKDILFRIDALLPKEQQHMQELKKCKNAKELLLCLEEKVKKTPIFSPEKKVIS